MAFQLAAIPLLGKALTALKGGTALKAAAGFGAGLPKSATAAKVIGGMPGVAKVVPAVTAATKTAATTGAPQSILGNATRMAGNVMKDYLGGSVTKKALLENFGLDAAFGIYAGLNEDGDIGDKVIRGLATAGSGGLGGVGATVGVGKLTGKMPEGFMRQATEFGGAMLGDQVGYSLADSLQRAKNGGLTAYEKEALRQQMEDMYASGGGDQFLYENGLG